MTTPRGRNSSTSVVSASPLATAPNGRSSITRRPLKSLQHALGIELIDGASNAGGRGREIRRRSKVKRDGRRLALDDQPGLGHLARHLVRKPLGHVHGLVRCGINVCAQPLRPSAPAKKTALHAVVAKVGHVPDSNSRGDIRRGPAREDHDMYARESGEGAQSAATQRQYLRAPRVVDNAAQGSIEVADHE